MEYLMAGTLIVVGFYIYIELQTKKTKRQISKVTRALKELGLDIHTLPKSNARLVRQVAFNRFAKNRSSFNAHAAAIECFLATSIKPGIPNYLMIEKWDRAATVHSMVVIEAWANAKKVSVKNANRSLLQIGEHLFGNDSSALSDPAAAEAAMILSRVRNSP